MIMPRDHLMLRLEAALATIKRLDDVTNIQNETWNALCQARYRLMQEIALLEELNRPR